MSADRLARIVLSSVFEPGDVRLPVMLRDYGAAGAVERLITGNEPRLRETSLDVGARLVEVNAARIAAEADRAGIRFVIPGDEEWPASLEELDDIEPVQEMLGAPVGLWVRGPLRLNDAIAPVAIVGSRNSSSYGSTLAAQMGAELAAAGRTVVSGAGLVH